MDLMLCLLQWMTILFWSLKKKHLSWGALNCLSTKKNLQLDPNLNFWRSIFDTVSRISLSLSPAPSYLFGICDLQSRSSTQILRWKKSFMLYSPKMIYIFFGFYSKKAVKWDCCHVDRGPPSSLTTQWWVVSNWPVPTVAHPAPSSSPSAAGHRSPPDCRWRSHGQRTARSGTQSFGQLLPSPGSLPPV